MWSIIGVIAVTMIIFLIDYPILRKIRDNRKDKLTFLILLCTGLILCILKLSGVPLYNPIKVIEYVYKPIHENVINWLL